MTERGQRVDCGSLRLMRLLAFVLDGAGIALLALGVPQVAAAQALGAAGPPAVAAAAATPPPAAGTDPNGSAPGDGGTAGAGGSGSDRAANAGRGVTGRDGATGSGGAVGGTGGNRGDAAAQPPLADDAAATPPAANDAATPPPAANGAPATPPAADAMTATPPAADGATRDGNGSPRTTGDTAGQGTGPESGAGPAAGADASSPRAGSAASESGGVTAGMPVWKLFAIDARDIFTAPAHWKGHDWAVFGIGTAAVAGLTLADKHLRTEALRGDAPLETRLANDFRYFGNYAAFSLLGAFYIGGRLGHNEKLQETAFDGIVASIFAGGVIAGVLKEVTGRVRPAAHRGVYTFHPFSGNASFPSGETTEAFAVGSVIAAHYPSLWVEIACYGTASLVGFARMRQDGHWASDVLAGALIGTTVGRAVVHINQRLRARVAVAPLLAPGTRGLSLHTAF
jgi:membrane-associated phospholipid phosphatase